MRTAKRRRAVLGTASVLAVVFCVVLTGCGSDDDSERGTPTTVEAGNVTGEFVGVADDGETYVALYASEGATSDQADVVAYVCNRRVDQPGQPIAEWFTGTAAKGVVELTSQSGGAKLRASLEPDGANGTADLPDGRSVTFQATGSESGPAGLFEVSVDDQGNLVGTSRGGKTMKLSSFEAEGQPGYTGTVTLPSGETVPYELFVRGGVLTKDDLVGMGTPRTIILADGSSRGILDPIARKGKGTTS